MLVTGVIGWSYYDLLMIKWKRTKKITLDNYYEHQ